MLAKGRILRPFLLNYRGKSDVRIIGFSGWSGAGKTTLLVKIIPVLVARGLRVSTVKHAHHGFDVDFPGKDSYSHRAAGAGEVLVSSKNRFALMHELRGSDELPLRQLLAKLGPADIVLVEGFKRENHPKVEIYRAANNKPPLHLHDPTIRVIASDVAFPDSGRDVYDIGDVSGIADAALTHAEFLETFVQRGA